MVDQVKPKVYLYCNMALSYCFNMKDIKDIQKNLRESIALSPLTQKEIANRLGIHPTTINSYMKKDKYPSLDTFASLCEILDVSADDILGLK